MTWSVRKKPWLLASTALLVLALGLPNEAAASLIVGGTVNSSGGFGTENTILTFHTNGTEVGCVKWTGSADAFGAPCPELSASSTNQTGGQTFSLSELAALGINSAGEIGIVLDAAQSGGGNITVVKLVLTFYSADGSSSQSFVYFPASPTSFPGSTGSGGQGTFFQLDWNQAQIANAAWFTGPNFGNNRIGFSAELNGGTGGQDTFFIFDATPQPVPEPATFLTIGSGLLGFAYWLRRRRLDFTLLIRADWAAELRLCRLRFLSRSAVLTACSRARLVNPALIRQHLCTELSMSGGSLTPNDENGLEL